MDEKKVAILIEYIDRIIELNESSIRVRSGNITSERWQGYAQGQAFVLEQVKDIRESLEAIVNGPRYR
jgi:hypothetical protein